MKHIHLIHICLFTYYLLTLHTNSATRYLLRSSRIFASRLCACRLGIPTNISNIRSKPWSNALAASLMLKKCENNLPLAVTKMKRNAKAKSFNKELLVFSLPFCNSCESLHRCCWPGKLSDSTSNSLKYHQIIILMKMPSCRRWMITQLL